MERRNEDFMPEISSFLEKLPDDLVKRIFPVFSP
jgi:hypothetical protein